MKHLLKDIRNYHLDELKRGNEYAFNIRETNGSYYNIVPSFELNYMLFNEEDISLKTMTEIIYSIITLANTSDFKLNMINENEILSIEFMYHRNLYRVTGEQVADQINIIICINPKFAKNGGRELCAVVYKNWTLLESFSLDLFKSPSILEHFLLSN